jgi:phage head maturation protease
MAASLRSVRCAPKRSSSTLREAIDSDGLAFVINVVCSEPLQPCVIHHRR